MSHAARPRRCAAGDGRGSGTESTGLTGFTRLPAPGAVTVPAAGSLLRADRTTAPRPPDASPRPGQGTPVRHVQDHAWSSTQSTGARGAVAEPVRPGSGAPWDRARVLRPASRGQRPRPRLGQGGGAVGRRGRPEPTAAPGRDPGAPRPPSPRRYALLCTPLRAPRAAPLHTVIIDAALPSPRPTPGAAAPARARRPVRLETSCTESCRIGCRASPPSSTMLRGRGSPDGRSATRGGPPGAAETCGGSGYHLTLRERGPTQPCAPAHRHGLVRPRAPAHHAGTAATRDPSANRPDGAPPPAPSLQHRRSPDAAC